MGFLKQVGFKPVMNEWGSKLMMTVMNRQKTMIRYVQDELNKK